MATTAPLPSCSAPLLCMEQTDSPEQNCESEAHPGKYILQQGMEEFSQPQSASGEALVCPEAHGLERGLEFAHADFVPKWFIPFISV